MRDFLEERRWEVIRDHVNRNTPPELQAIYRQNPLLDWMWNATGKEMVAYRKRFLAEQEAAGNILPRKKDADR